MKPHVKDTEPGRHYCLACRAHTEWALKRKKQECGGCGMQFPCSSRSCTHQDCRAARSPGRGAA